MSKLLSFQFEIGSLLWYFGLILTYLGQNKHFGFRVILFQIFNFAMFILNFEQVINSDFNWIETVFMLKDKKKINCAIMKVLGGLLSNGIWKWFCELILWALMQFCSIMEKEKKFGWQVSIGNDTNILTHYYCKRIWLGSVPRKFCFTIIAKERSFQNSMSNFFDFIYQRKIGYRSSLDAQIWHPI